MARTKDYAMRDKIKNERKQGLFRQIAWMKPQPKRADGQLHGTRPIKASGAAAAGTKAAK
jgi:hypothetical protein